MTYVDALKIKDTIHVSERDANGNRKVQKFPAKYTMYMKNPNGEYVSIYGDSLKKYTFGTYSEHNNEVQQSRPGSLFEHDINPVFRFLEENYSGADVPNLHVAFFDIEVDFDPNIGFSSPEDPYCEVNAISVYQSWTGENHTVVLKPKTIRKTFMENGEEVTKLIPLTEEEALEICATFDNTTLCKDELELYNKFFELIYDADVLSGWNSTGFDIPYLIMRLERIKHKEKAKKFCLWGQAPRKRNFEKFGKEQFTFDLFGRVHLDYLDLYQKHTYHEMHSYSLDAVSDYEVGEKKVSYSGSLDMLYKADFKLFIDYNRQDTMLLVKIDEKNKFIELSNALAHEMTVTLQTTLGSVALIETAICKEIHSRGLIAPSKKKPAGEATSVAGAYVASPIKGLHSWVGSVDINSLYPSVIRSLNISPETIIGQIRLTDTMQKITNHLHAKSTNTLADAWGEFFGVLEYNALLERDDSDSVTVDFEDNTSMSLSSSEWYNTIFADESGMCVSGNGTLFRTDKKGIIPGLLERWYNERVEIRKEAEILFSEMDKLEDGPEKTELKKQIAFRDQRQLIKKILLNSLYGALLNPYCRFFDQRMGQSVTLTGRCITKHMMAKMNEIFTGEYKHDGEAIIYGDTDSVISDTIIKTSMGEQTIEQLFHGCNIKWNNHNKEYTTDDSVKVYSYNKNTNSAELKNINYIYRHKVKKKKWKIVDSEGNQIIVTNDHSIMVERNGVIIEVKPSEIDINTDYCIVMNK